MNDILRTQKSCAGTSVKQRLASPSKHIGNSIKTRILKGQQMTKATMTPAKKRTKTRAVGASLSLLMVMLAPQATLAQSNALPSGAYQAGAERIDLASQIQANSQEIAALQCLVSDGVDVEANLASLKQVMTSTDALLAALTSGDEAYNVALPETGQKMLDSIQRVQVQWGPYREWTQLISQAGVTSDQSNYLARHNLNVLHGAKLLESQVLSEYTIPPALLQSDAFTLLIAMRQRTLLQQIKKEVCGIASGNRVLGNQARLQNAQKLFDLSLGALQNGLPGAGVSAPPNDAIANQLADVAVTWADAKTGFDTFKGASDMDAAVTLLAGIDAVSAKMSDVAPLYVAAIRERN